VSKKITFLDKTFWITESEANPKHVAGLQLLELPKEAPTDYVEQLFAELRGFDKALSPFNCKVSCFLGFPIKLTPVEQLNMDYHVQMHEFDDINNKPELHKFIAQLHEPWLDRDKPLWQYHLIKDKDKENQGFAIYIKVLHIYGDGATLCAGFKIAIVPVELGHGKKDPYLKLRQIIENHRIIKRTTRLSNLLRSLIIRF
jgi:diacylglycerol O-acyltransferase